MCAREAEAAASPAGRIRLFATVDCVGECANFEKASVPRGVPSGQHKRPTMRSLDKALAQWLSALQFVA